MQCLNATTILVESYLGLYENSANLIRNSKLNSAESGLNGLLKDFFSSYRRKSGGSCNPSSLFSGICRVSSRFRGFSQQDSHDVFITLLDGIVEEQKKQVFAKRKKTDPNCPKNPKRIQICETGIGQIFGSFLCNRGEFLN
jgi:hypothetical protein